MSDDEWDDEQNLQSERIYVQSAKDRFLKRITEMHQKIVNPVNNEVEECVKTQSKSAEQLLNEYYCKYCGFKGTLLEDGTSRECSCGGEWVSTEFQMWVENKALNFDVFNFATPLFVEEPNVNKKPSEMSWQQLTNALSPQLVFDDEKPTETEEISSVESSVDSDGEYEIVTNEELSELKKSLTKLEENHTCLIAEREYLIQQLQACEDRIEDIVEEKAVLVQEIEEQCAAGENAIATELLSCLDEFSQAVQILLDGSEFYDIDDLIRSYTRDGATPETIKKEIIFDAKLHKKRMLMGDSTETYLPKTEDGLPRLHDSYITDSFAVHSYEL